MARIFVFFDLPVLRGGKPSYRVGIIGQGNFGIRFSTAKEALQQFEMYKKQGHTFTRNLLSKQSQTLRFFKQQATKGH